MNIPPLADLRNDPYPVFARLRAEAPVAFSNADSAWLVSKYEDVITVLKASSTYSNRQSGLERVLVGSGASRHVESRRTVQPAFSTESLQTLEPIIADISRKIVANAISEGHVDGVRALAMPIPGAIFSELLGVPHVEEARLIGWASGITRFAIANLSERPIGTTQRLKRGVRQMYRAATEPSYRHYADAKSFIEAQFRGALKVESRSVLTRALVDQHVRGSLTWNELTSIGLEFAFAATETTSSLIGSSLRILSEDPSLQDYVREDQTRLLPFLEEVLRFTSPLQFVKRFAEVESVLNGVTIPARSPIRVLIASANRDEEIFPSAERFIATRTPNPHLAFGAGPHTCPGSRLARLEAKILLAELLNQTRFIKRADTGGSLEYRGYSGSRGLKALPLLVG